MSNNLNQPVEISPGVRDTNADGTPDTNIPTVAFGETLGAQWVSQWFPVQGTPHGADEISVMAYVDWQGAAQIDLLTQFRHAAPAMPQDSLGQAREPVALPLTAFDGTKIDPTSFEVSQDIISLLLANFRIDPGAQEIPLQVAGVSEFRLLARAPAGSPVLRVQVLAGGAGQ